MEVYFRIKDEVAYSLGEGIRVVLMQITILESDCGTGGVGAAANHITKAVVFIFQIRILQIGYTRTQGQGFAPY